VRRLSFLLLTVAVAAIGIATAAGPPTRLDPPRTASELPTVERAASATPGPRDFVDDLRLVGEGMQWTYLNTGDYNLDGLVGVSDITPIGQYWGAREGDANWDKAQLADGNQDGMITVSDITPIGQNFGHMVAGYEVWGGDSVGGEWSLMGRATMEYLQTEGGQAFFYVGVSGFSLYRVWPYDGSDDEGWWSNYAFAGHDPAYRLARLDHIW